MAEFSRPPNQLLSVLVAVLLIFSPIEARSSSTPANELFVNAVTLHRQAVDLPPEERAEKLQKIRDLFDRILAEHPDSDVAEMLRTNPMPAGVVIANLPPSKSHSLEIGTEAKEGDDRNSAPKASSTDVIVGGSVSSSDDGILAPVGGVDLTLSATYFDLDYPTSWNPPAQHLGVDLPAPEGAVVRSPITGTVVINRTDRRESFNKYLIVRDSENEQEHVFGHIDSDLAEIAEVGVGSELGTIVSAGTGPHLHWGINSGSILDTFSDGWGFGRAPLGATREEAQSRGWLDPEQWFEALAKRTSTPKPRIEESAGSSQVALFEALPDGLYSTRAEVCSHQGESVVETLDRDFRLLNRPRLSMFDVTCDIEGASEANDAVEITVSCNAEGVAEKRLFRWQISGSQNFTEFDAFGGTKKFQLCANTAPPGRARADDTTADASAQKERQIGPGLLGPWAVQTEPDQTLKIGEQSRGLAVSANGDATFRGKPLFEEYRAREPDYQRLSIFVDDAERRAVVLFMRDGAERIALVDLKAGTILNDAPRPFWRYGPTDDVIWDPSGRYAALRMPMAEYSTGLGIFELETGRYELIPDRAFDANALDSWLADSLETRLDGTLSVDVARERLDEYGKPIASDGTPPETRIIEIEALFDGSTPNSESGSNETAGEPEADALANQIWDNRIVVSEETGIFNRTYGDLVSPIDELRAAGVSDRAVAFSRAFAEAADSGKAGEFVAVDFTELGAVDLVRVEPAYTRSTSSPLHSYVLTARQGTLRRLSFPVEMSRNLGRYATDRTSRRVLAGQPDPWIVDHYVTGHRRLPSGAQRFVLQGPVSGSCRVCEWIGHAIVYVDVDERGDVLRHDLVGVIADSAVPDEEITPADIVARLDLQQYMLNKFGYDAGPMDGAVGPRTRQAIAAFQRDHCLTVSGTLTAPVARALVELDTLSPPNCAAGTPLAVADVKAAPDDARASPRSAARTEGNFTAVQGTMWVQIASRSDLSEARAIAQAAGESARIFEAQNGIYAITATILSEPEFSGLADLIAYNGWPEDSYLTRGAGFVAELPLETGEETERRAFTKTETRRLAKVYVRSWRDGTPIYEEVDVLAAGAEVTVWGESDDQGDCLVDAREAVFMKCADLRGFDGLARADETKRSSASDSNMALLGPPVGTGPMRELTRRGDNPPECSLKTALPDVDEFTWTGECRDGEAYGAGRLEFFRAGMLQEMLRVGPDRDMRLGDGVLRWRGSFPSELRLTKQASAFGGMRWANATFVVPDTFNAHSKNTLHWLVREAARHIQQRGFQCRVGARIGGGCYNLVITSDPESAAEMRRANGSIEHYPANYVRASLTPELNLSVVGRSPSISYGAAQQEFAKDLIARNREVSEAQWAEEMEAILGDAGTRIDNIADLLRFDEKDTLAALAAGRQITISPDEVAFRDGAAIVIDRQEPTDIYTEIVPEELVTKDGGWGAFLDAARQAGAVGDPSGVVVSCSMNIDEIPESGAVADRTFDAVLKSYDRGSLALACSKKR